jgi:hypothetical protein
MIKFAPTYPASETFDLKLGGVLRIAGSILRNGSAPGVVFAVSAPEGLHRYLYRVSVPSERGGWELDRRHQVASSSQVLPTI